MATEQALSVVTDSARDLLQSADVFSNEKLVAWEYISNGLQYVDPGTSPHVDVVVDTKQKRMVISDNGSGMTLQGLKNFFVMHGENVERKQGKPGRGRFGTGKSAAFGIANSLRITTVRDGKRSIVELTRADIEAARTDEGPVESVPVRVLAAEQTADEANGTVIEIDGIKLAKLDPQAIVGFVERHLAVWPNKDAVVTVNGRICEYHEPPIRFERSFITGSSRRIGTRSPRGWPSGCSRTRFATSHICVPLSCARLPRGLAPCMRTCELLDALRMLKGCEALLELVRLVATRPCYDQPPLRDPPVLRLRTDLLGAASSDLRRHTGVSLLCQRAGAASRAAGARHPPALVPAVPLEKLTRPERAPGRACVAIR